MLHLIFFCILTVFVAIFCSLMYRRESMSMEEIEQAASSWPSADGVFSEGDIERIVTHMETANKLMIHDGLVHLI